MPLARFVHEAARGSCRLRFLFREILLTRHMDRNTRFGELDSRLFELLAHLGENELTQR